MALKSKPPLALIAGPTASGKTALALALAEHSGGVVINADSAQVYRDLPILSAAPTAQERNRAEHRLYGYLDGSIACSAADWAARARQEIEEIYASGRLPILAGGTGLYLRSLLEGLAPMPDIDPDVRRRVREASVEDNRRELEVLDAASAAKLKPGDTARTARALEVVVSTGRSITHWQKRREGGIGDRILLRPIVLLPEREWLYRRCDERFARMMEQGAVEEVERLLDRGLDQQLPVMRAIGVREIKAYLDGKMTIDEALAAGQRATRRYAKRQYTWFAHQPPAEWPRLSSPLEREQMASALELLSEGA